jgi:hypothetical protein
MTRQRTFFAVALLVALVLAGGVSIFASSAPDGLEKVAEDKGFIGTAQDHELADSPLADYGVKGVENSRLSGGLAGVIGVTLTLAVSGGLFLVLRRRTSVRAETSASGRPAAAGSPGTEDD